MSSGCDLPLAGLMMSSGIKIYPSYIGDYIPRTGFHPVLDYVLNHFFMEWRVFEDCSNSSLDMHCLPSWCYHADMDMGQNRSKHWQRSKWSNTAGLDISNHCTSWSYCQIMWNPHVSSRFKKHLKSTSLMKQFPIIVPVHFQLGRGWMLCWWVRPSCLSRRLMQGGTPMT